MDVHVLVPLKRLDRAKSRLAAVLSTSERAALMEALLDGVVEAVRDAGVTRITLVTPEPLEHSGAERWYDRGLPWNAALRAAMFEVVSENLAAVIAADLPFLQARDVEALIAATPSAGIAIARAGDGGTNAVSMRPPGAVPTHFGTPASAGRHAEAAQALRLDHVVLDLPGLAFDVDTPEDLERIEMTGLEVGH